jgi:hypothetical protein
VWEELKKVFEARSAMTRVNMHWQLFSVRYREEVDAPVRFERLAGMREQLFSMASS